MHLWSWNFNFLVLMTASTLSFCGTVWGSTIYVWQMFNLCWLKLCHNLCISTLGHKLEPSANKLWAFARMLVMMPTLVTKCWRNYIYTVRWVFGVHYNRKPKKLLWTWNIHCIFSAVVVSSILVNLQTWGCLGTLVLFYWKKV